MQMVFGDGWGRRQRRVVRFDRLLQPATLHVRRQQHARRRAVPAVDDEPRGDDPQRLVELPRAQQEFGRMERIGPVAGRQRIGPARSAIAGSGWPMANAVAA